MQNEFLLEVLTFLLIYNILYGSKIYRLYPFLLFKKKNCLRNLMSFIFCLCEVSAFSFLFNLCFLYFKMVS